MRLIRESVRKPSEKSWGRLDDAHHPNEDSRDLSCVLEWKAKLYNDTLLMGLHHQRDSALGFPNLAVIPGRQTAAFLRQTEA